MGMAKKQTVSRENCFDFSPWVLHVPNDVEVTITAGADSELTVHRTDNETMFDARLYTPEECASEERGKGTMREASTRIVRTVSIIPMRRMPTWVVGEVSRLPRQVVELPAALAPAAGDLFYRFLPENGYGFAELSEDVVKTHNNSTVLITKKRRIRRLPRRATRCGTYG